MKNLFVPYEIAKALKEKGYDEPCLGAYFNQQDGVVFEPDTTKYPQNNFTHYFSGVQNSIHAEHFNKMVCAPMYQQVVDWFRVKHDIHIWVSTELGMTITYCWQMTGEDRGANYKAYHKSYYDALINAFETALKLI